MSPISGVAIRVLRLRPLERLQRQRPEMGVRQPRLLRLPKSLRRPLRPSTTSK